MITLDQLRAIMPQAGKRAEIFCASLNATMDEFGIDTPERQAAFLAQVAHESAQLHYTREIWDPAKCAWQARYEGRADLGNTEPGDGERFMGRGLIQVTGRTNYRNCSRALYSDENHLLDHPEILELPDPACRSAGWFWLAHRLNDPADKGQFEHITRIINGGLTGQPDRLAFYERAQQVLA